MIEEEFGRMANLRDHWWLQGRINLIDRYIKKNEKVLEIGCGIGQNIGGMNGIGLEPDENAVKHAKACGITVVRGVAEALPFKEKSFDAVLLMDVLEHMEDDTKPLKETSNVLSKGGTVIVTVPGFKILWRHHDEIMGHKRRYAKMEIESLLKSSGFEIEKLSYWNLTSFFSVFLMKFVKRSGKSDLIKTPKLLNKLLLTLLTIENRLISKTALPFGVSVFAVGKMKK